MPVKIDKTKCPQNHPCPSVNVCPEGALSQTGFAAPIVDKEKCSECGICASFCPMNVFSKDA